ncbi:hypothetical protein MD484_g579, partial [Candolleomyces efflorescens]
MKTSTLFSIFASVFLSSISVSLATEDVATAANVTDAILSNAEADGIDLFALDPAILSSALSEIESVQVQADEAAATERRRRSLGHLMGRQTPDRTDIVDVHTHAVPDWFKSMVPTTGGNPTPVWTIADHVTFMNNQGIDKAIIAVSAPGASVYPGQKGLTVALARLLNEQVALYCRAFPKRLGFYAVIPLPYTQEAIAEARYAINNLGAVGVVLLSNHETKYLGHADFKPFFQALNGLGGRQIVYVHPNTPYVKSGNTLIEANPTPYPTGNIEFYFETARTLMDLTLTQTIHNFTNIHYVIPHVGGAFPATLDRILKSVPAIYDSSLQIYNTRFWWDSAGPTYYHQVAGLLGIGVPKSQFLFGTDFPYAPIFTQAGSLAAVKASTLFSAAEKTAIFKTNAQNLFGNKLPH